MTSSHDQRHSSVEKEIEYRWVTCQRCKATYETNVDVEEVQYPFKLVMCPLCWDGTDY